MASKREQANRERFLRVFSRRKAEAIEKIKMMARCADKHNYHFFIEEIEGAKREIEVELDKCFFGYHYGVNEPKEPKELKIKPKEE